MAEYIEREAVINDIGELFTICFETLPNECGHHFIVEKELQTHLDFVRNIPAADVQPVVHGHWIKNEGRHGWHCSVCGEDDFYAFAWNSDKGENELQDRYCPNCGARMVGDADGQADG